MYMKSKKVRSLREDVSSFASFVWEVNEISRVTFTVNRSAHHVSWLEGSKLGYLYRSIVQ